MTYKKRIGIAGCKNTTIECISSLIDLGYEISLVITIDDQTAEKNRVAGFVNNEAFCQKHSIERYLCDSYSLKSEIDQSNLSALDLDVLIVIGWQRLIPEWLLNKLSIGAFGMHGSARALPYGRGRSPMNWSIIQGKNVFITNLFRYTPGVDDGDLVATVKFDINEYDTGQTCHYKNLVSMIKSLEDNLPKILNETADFYPQKNVAPTFYPKRTAEDGTIFWDRDTDEICRLIRAVTYPFPGAITYVGNKKIVIWEAQPFDTRLYSEQIDSGTVLNVFQNDDFVIKTGSDTILVTKWKSEGYKVQRGDKCHSNDRVYKCPYNYPEA